MYKSLKIAIAQLNFTVGDIVGNANKLRNFRNNAPRDIDLIVSSELCITGYPPEDLILKPEFQQQSMAMLQLLAEETSDGGPAWLLGTPWLVAGQLERRRVYNAAVVLDHGRIVGIYHKRELPNYGVFDEQRFFVGGDGAVEPIVVRNTALGVMICEDMWQPKVADQLKQAGAKLLVVLNASPFDQTKLAKRQQLAKQRIMETGLPLIYVNQIGGQDDLVFDGGSFVMDRQGTINCQLARFQEDQQYDCLAVQNANHKANHANDKTNHANKVGSPQDLAIIYQAMMLGLRDYVRKNQFSGVLLGLSGGIDSALTAAVAVDALGADQVHCVILPSKFTSQNSLDDAVACAQALGVSYDIIPINLAVDTVNGMLQPVFSKAGYLQSDITEENLQARIRGLLLMALSNKFGAMLLTTGNKSELAVGYYTLYGDSCGGYSVLKDVYKTQVFALSAWRNVNLPEQALGIATTVIPERILTKAPSAELRFNQTDQDSLPPYELLDLILQGLIELDLSQAELVAQGYDAEVVDKVQSLLLRSEYKRRQSAPGVKVTAKCFELDRRYPLTNKFAARVINHENS